MSAPFFRAVAASVHGAVDPAALRRRRRSASAT
jgi:hypothetical protein